MRFRQASSELSPRKSNPRLAVRPRTGMTRRGVTLIEMLFVVTIITILVSMGFIMFSMGSDFAERLQANASGAVARSKRATAPKVARSGPVLLTDRQIVVFNSNVTDVQAEVNRLSSTLNMQVIRVYTAAMKGMTVRTDSVGLMALRTDPAVAYVQQARQFKATTQTVPTGVRRMNAPWNKTSPIPTPGTVVIGGPINLPPTNATPTKSPVAVVDTGID